MNALVTGATGFVGSHLAERLIRAGHTVTALVRSPARAAHLAPLGIRQVRGDLHDTAALRTATEGQDLIFHVAGLVAARDERDFLRGNRDATANLLAAATETSSGHPPRFVLVSSLAAAGPSGPGAPLRGDEPLRPVTQYGRSKLAGEEVVRAGSLPWTIVRPPMVYGPRDTEVLKVFKLARGGIAPVFGDGTQELSAVYGPDLADALLVVGTAPGAAGRTYFATHAETFTSRELLDRVARALGRRVRILSLPDWLARPILGVTATAARLAGRTTILTPDKANEFFQPAWTADPGLLTRNTGRQAAHDLDRGLAATAAWYREHGWL